jgi:hypothetical protein
MATAGGDLDVIDGETGLDRELMGDRDARRTESHGPDRPVVELPDLDSHRPGRATLLSEQVLDRQSVAVGSAPASPRTFPPDNQVAANQTTDLTKSY